MDNNSQDSKDMQEALEAYQAYKAHKASSGPQSQQSSLGGFLSKLGAPVAALADAGANALTFGNLPSIMDARSKLVGGDTGEDFKQRLSQEQSEHPVASAVGALEGGILPGLAAGGALAGVLPTSAKILPSAVRAASNIGSAGLMGYLRAPQGNETRTGNAVNTMESPLTWGPVAAIEGLNQGVRAAQGASEAFGQTDLGKWLGGKLTKMTPEQVEAYHRDPELAEQVYGEAKNDPGALINRAESQAQQAIDKVQQNYIDPRKAELSRLGVGKSFRVNPADFEGTEAHPIIQDVYNKQGNTVDVPTHEVTPTFEARPTQSLSDSETQNIHLPGSYQDAQVPISEVNRGWDVVPSDPLVNPESSVQSYPKPMGDSVSLNMEPTLRAKRAASNAANLINQRRPLGISAADNDSAQANAQAAVNLGKATKSIEGVNDLDEDIHNALGHIDEVRGKGNLASLFSPTDNAPIGTAKTRAAADFLDKEGGSSIGDTADALSAAKTLNSPHRVQGFSFHSLFQPTGKYLIKAGASPNMDKQAALIPEKALQSLFSLENK